MYRILLAAFAGLATATFVSAQGTVPEEAPRDVTPAAALLAGAPVATIASGPLRVTVALPDARRGFYRSTRFDWSGMITDVTLGSAHFYGLWFDGVAANIRDFVDSPAGVFVGPRNAASGPAEEFANRDGETVPGYDSTPVGGTFIKIGVGRLRKADAKPYDHFRAYTIVDGGTWTVSRRRDRIVFRQRLAPDAVGYGYEYEKTLSVAPGGTMTIAHRLRNIGTKPIATQVYNHNFARFDGAEIGKGVTVRFPSAVTGSVSDTRLASVEGDTLQYITPLTPTDRLQLPAQPGGPSMPSGPFRVSGANGATITMQADVPLVRAAFWSIRCAVAVEPFVAIAVAPGGEQHWTWRYTYTNH